jgi:hypothetical protein
VVHTFGTPIPLFGVLVRCLGSMYQVQLDVAYGVFVKKACLLTTTDGRKISAAVDFGSEGVRPGGLVPTGEEEPLGGSLRRKKCFQWVDKRPWARG